MGLEDVRLEETTEEFVEDLMEVRARLETGEFSYRESEDLLLRYTTQTLREAGLSNREAKDGAVLLLNIYRALEKEKDMESLSKEAKALEVRWMLVDHIL